MIPYDISRCDGIRVAALCNTCQRRTPGRPDGPQSYISPAVHDEPGGFEVCPNYIPPPKATE